MYSRSVLAIKYLQYYLSAANSRGHGVHSPFVFRFIKDILRDDSAYQAYEQVALVRRHMLRDITELAVTDYGAGSGVDRGSNRKISSIAKHALKPPKYANLLYRMVRYFEPEAILELGTSLGTTTALLAMANPAANVITMEGASAVAAVAAKNFNALNIHNIRQITGNFDETLPELASGTTRFDFIFLDGNHRYEPTMRYFNLLLPVVHEYTVVVMDDIHWSSEMEIAWGECRNHPAVTLSIDLFFIGILFFRSEFLVKQHFVIRF
jgi:predicted O-methyltransferase YrrM